jgi:proteasome lid subunit RPN8/RPN11
LAVIAMLIPKELIRQIERQGIAAYPNECCGILFGRDSATVRGVERIEAVANDFDESEQFHRFSISPQQLVRAEKSATERNEIVLGFYHSHPDHPARPSEYDRAHAWPFYSYVIVSIQNRAPVDLTSWVLNEETQSFARQDVIETNEKERQGKP